MSQRKTNPHRLFSVLSALFLSAAFLGLSNTADAGPYDRAKTKTVTAGDVTYAYREFGKTRGVPALLSQRFRGDMDDWDPAFLNALAKKRRVIVFDSLGVAETGGTVPTTIKGMADSAVALLDGLDIPTVDIVGWSMGGFVAQVLPIEHPNRVRRVVMIGTGPGGSPETPASPEYTFQVATKAEWAEEDHAYLFFAGEQSGADASDSIERVRRNRDGKLTPSTSAEVMQNQAQAIVGFLSGEGDYFSRLKEISQPTLIVMGDRDAFFPLAGTPLLYREIPDARVAVYPMAGHGPQHQFPKLVADQIISFLK